MDAKGIKSVYEKIQTQKSVVQYLRQKYTLYKETPKNYLLNWRTEPDRNAQG
jgi:hypothetical protein